MQLKSLDEVNINDFVAYCLKHRNEVDDSFLYDQDLEHFMFSSENPTYLVYSPANEVLAVVSLIIDDYHRRGRKGRFRIFHSEVDSRETYLLLWNALKPHLEGIDHVFVFVPFTNNQLVSRVEELGFQIERYTYVLVRQEKMTPFYQLPEGYQIRPFRSGLDEDSWCSVRNKSFATVKGNETPITPDMVSKMVLDKDYIDGGMLVLYHFNHPIGVIKGASDAYDGKPIMNIGTVAIDPDYQGKGLGRCLLRAALQMAKDKGYDRTILCVNADNEGALALYLKEGFIQAEGVICYTYNLIK
ncbi:GNAT family N-acetyltransferase [Neobacillus sp. 19]|uniref:GNAT family N-acetyltransferase n=1 Tax=Neobacillus sp. 19 TaxID=3394458 RepID=UPI003BF713E6